jgi:hypothetical protein
MIIKRVIGGMMLGFFGIEPFKAHAMFDMRLVVFMVAIGGFFVGWSVWEQHG